MAQCQSFVNLPVTTKHLSQSLNEKLPRHITRFVFRPPPRAAIVGNGCPLCASARFFVGREYMAVLRMTRKAPNKNRKFGRKSKANADITHDSNMLNELAKTFKTLSAYLTTTATMRPPTACTVITETTMGEYPTKNPFRVTSSESSATTVTKAMKTEGMPIWMFRIHRLTSEPFSIFSKYTPLNPDVHAAERTATRPTRRFRSSSSDASWSLLPETCTTATPNVSTTRDAHLVVENRRLSMVALNMAVVSIFIW
mmetsp:Transcript_43819/g.93175  ORF Transcript_43819/g.93175 Transcript_43819/m.93175 type:complete len:255 (+) Transcript_43819:390-1154(+)